MNKKTAFPLKSASAAALLLACASAAFASGATRTRTAPVRAVPTAVPNVFGGAASHDRPLQPPSPYLGLRALPDLAGVPGPVAEHVLDRANLSAKPFAAMPITAVTPDAHALQVVVTPTEAEGSAVRDVQRGEISIIQAEHESGSASMNALTQGAQAVLEAGQGMDGEATDKVETALRQVFENGSSEGSDETSVPGVGSRDSVRTRLKRPSLGARAAASIAGIGTLFAASPAWAHGGGGAAARPGLGLAVGLIVALVVAGLAAWAIWYLFLRGRDTPRPPSPLPPTLKQASAEAAVELPKAAPPVNAVGRLEKLAETPAAKELLAAMRADSFHEFNPFAYIWDAPALADILRRGVAGFKRSIYRTQLNVTRWNSGYDMVRYEIAHTDGSKSVVDAMKRADSPRSAPMLGGPDLRAIYHQIFAAQDGGNMAGWLYKNGALQEQGALPSREAGLQMAERFVNDSIAQGGLHRLASPDQVL